MPIDDVDASASAADPVFEPEDVIFVRAALELAWDNLPPRRRTPANRIALATSVVRVAGRGERDPGRLSIRALQAMSPEAPIESL
jgi:hypothetical protein